MWADELFLCWLDVCVRVCVCVVLCVVCHPELSLLVLLPFKYLERHQLNLNMLNSHA